MYELLLSFIHSFIHSLRLKYIPSFIIYQNVTLFFSEQSSTEALIAATSYLDLFLRSITDANLMKVFLEFIMVERSDGTPILDLLVSRISHESQASIVGGGLIQFVNV